MPRPGPAPDAATRAEFDRVLDEAVLAGPDQFIDYRMAAPKWQFLCYAADRGGFVLHGTGNPDIATFEPRQSNDVDAFGNRCAVYAASDGLWPMYFAILDRDRYDMGLTNASIQRSGWKGRTTSSRSPVLRSTSSRGGTGSSICCLPTPSRSRSRSWTVIKRSGSPKSPV